ncbi:MAG TPA: FAD-dependent oxidoreductase [Candidatus Binataceae bacterium]|nr:FAD-dependent oxidoreductase [Candidatus Binataceae bacterium]
MPILTRGSFANAATSLALKTGDWRLQRPQYRHRSAPCAVGCPAGENPQAYIAMVAEGNLRGAWEMLVAANPLPAITGRVCHHPCESACHRGSYDQPIAIHSVERFLGDRAIAEGWNYPLKPSSPDAPRVAVVGAGPAGLSAAYHLARLGLSVTLFDAEPEPGGLLRSALPPYRLPRTVLNSEIARLLAVGIAFKPNRRVGRDVSIDELRADFQAIFLGPGTSRPREWSVDGTVPSDLRTGLDLLREWISIGAIPTYNRVAIIGGGNTAIDLARVLKFSGVDEVHLITFQALPGPAVRREEAMSAAPREIGQALEEGVTIHDRRGVRRLIMRGNRVVGVETVHMKELGTATGERKLVSFEGTETILKVDHVIPAIGQQLDSSVFGNLLGQPGIFVGGDARSAAGTVSGAIGDGCRAAIAIRNYLDGLPPAGDEMPRPIAFDDLNINYFDHAPRAEALILEVEHRSAEKEIEAGISHQDLNAEAHRCFSCGECMSCDNCWTLCPDNAVLKADTRDGWRYAFDYDHCKGCGICANECPVGFITMFDEQ